MTIDKAIAVLKAVAPFGVKGDAINVALESMEELQERRNESQSLQRTIIKLNEIVSKQGEELQWYRRQDLIKRDDAFAFINKHFDIREECILPYESCEDWVKENESCKDCIKKHIQQIPKAEPPKMRDANIEEIKNTNNYLKTISKPTGIHFEAEQPKDYSLYTNKPIEVHNKDDWDRFQKDINGDCETCKHYDTEVCGECFKSMGESKYEPYIPKENTDETN